MSLLALLSPAKKQTQCGNLASLRPTQPRCKQQTAQLVEQLKTFTKKDLEQNLSISPSLAALNHTRYQDFTPERYHLDNASPCLFAFQGDAYKALAADTLTQDEVTYLQEHLRILSGLYGLLRPMDLIQAYRLEMGIPLKNDAGDTLYDFWQQQITKMLNQECQQNGMTHIINLASQEYTKAIIQADLSVPFVTIAFKQPHKGQYKTIGILSKKARGQMTRFIATKKPTTLTQLKKFNTDGYQYNAELSDKKTLVFLQQ